MPESTIPRCPTCGRDALAVARAVHDVTADDGTLLRYEDEVYRCGHCGESVYTPDQSLASSRARATALRGHEGLLSPAQITAIREKLGLSQAALERALGIGPKTVVRWEKGTVRQSRTADLLLRTIAAHPAVLAQIVAGRGVHLEIPDATAMGAIADVRGAYTLVADTMLTAVSFVAYPPAALNTVMVTSMTFSTDSVILSSGISLALPAGNSTIAVSTQGIGCGPLGRPQPEQVEEGGPIPADRSELVLAA